MKHNITNLLLALILCVLSYIGFALHGLQPVTQGQLDEALDSCDTDDCTYERLLKKIPISNVENINGTVDVNVKNAAISLEIER